MRFSKVLVTGIVLLTANTALTQTPSYTNVGRTPTKEEIQAWDIAAGPDGKGLPPGQGNAGTARRSLPQNAPCATARLRKAARLDLAWWEAKPTSRHSLHSGPS